MTTKLNRKVKRKSQHRYRGKRHIIVTLYPNDLIGFREERLRKEFVIPIVAAYEFAVKIEVMHESKKDTRIRVQRAK